MRPHHIAAVIALAPIALFACTPDTPETEPQPDSSNPALDMGAPAPVADMKSPDAPSADMNANTRDSGEDQENNAADVDPLATCETSPAHPRCDADPATFNAWGPSSVVSSISFVADDSCCFDIDGDGETDNVLGELLELAQGFDVDVESFNASVADSIAAGSLILLVEYPGATAAGGDFAINYYLGLPEGEPTAPSASTPNLYKVSPDSLRQGTWPTARMSSAAHDGATLDAGPGAVDISTELLGPPITLRINSAQIRAELAPDTDFDAGQVHLTGGQLGGAVRVSDIFDAINDVYDASCSCAPLPEGSRLITYDVAALEDAACSTPDNDTSGCDQESVCVSVYDLCSFVGIAGRVADIDADNPTSDCAKSETCDAISLGTTFETVGATITGVAR